MNKQTKAALAMMIGSSLLDSASGVSIKDVHNLQL